MSRTRYVAYDYEEPGEPDNYWHIYSLDNEPSGVSISPTVMTIIAPYSPEMVDAIKAICLAIDAAIDRSQR